MAFNYSGPYPIQSANSGSGAQNTGDIVLPYGANVTLNNLLIAADVWYPDNAAPAGQTVTDTLGNTWTKAASVALGASIGGLALYWALANASGADSVTQHDTPSLFKAQTIIELPGLASTAVDVSSTNTGNSTTPTATSITPAAAGEFVICALTTTAASVVAPPPGWATIQYHAGGADMQLWVGGYLTLGTAALAPAFTAPTGGAWAVIQVAFKNMGPAAAGFLAPAPMLLTRASTY